MTVTPIFTGTVRQNRLVINETEKWRVHLAGLEGKAVEVVVRRWRSKRSLAQNRFYWGIVIEILGDHFGYTKDEMHEALKFKFLRTHEEEGLPTVRSTTTLNTKEFIDYIERIQRWAATDYQIYVPDPNEAVESRELPE
jgi:hypothetical protein